MGKSWLSQIFVTVAKADTAQGTKDFHPPTQLGLAVLSVAVPGSCPGGCLVACCVSQASGDIEGSSLQDRGPAGCTLRLPPSYSRFQVAFLRMHQT